MVSDHGHDSDKFDFCGFHETSIGHNYLKLSLKPLSVKVDVSPVIELTGSLAFTVKLGSSYTTNLGPGITGELWLLGMTEWEYSPDEAKSVTVDGNPITLKSALAQHAGMEGKLAADAAYLFAFGGKEGHHGVDSHAQGSVVQSSGSRNRLGSHVSTGGSH